MFTVRRIGSIAYGIIGAANGAYTFVYLVAGGIDPYGAGIAAIAGGVVWPVPLAYNAYRYVEAPKK